MRLPVRGEKNALLTFREGFLIANALHFFCRLRAFCPPDTRSDCSSYTRCATWFVAITTSDELVIHPSSPLTFIPEPTIVSDCLMENLMNNLSVYGECFRFILRLPFYSISRKIVYLSDPLEVENKHPTAHCICLSPITANRALIWPRDVDEMRCVSQHDHRVRDRELAASS